MRTFYQKMENDVIISIRGMQDFEGVGDDAIELVTEGSVRRSRLYYLRDLKGKAARIKPKKRY